MDGWMDGYAQQLSTLDGVSGDRGASVQARVTNLIHITSLQHG
jgi:hypothetical protein